MAFGWMVVCRPASKLRKLAFIPIWRKTTHFKLFFAKSVCLKGNLVHGIWAAHTRILNMLRTSPGSTGQVLRTTRLQQRHNIRHRYSRHFSFEYQSHTFYSTALQTPKLFFDSPGIVPVWVRISLMKSLVRVTVPSSKNW